MGCFDTVHLTCPHCKEDVEEQTKSGPCALKDYYNLNTTPMSVMEGVIGRIHCYHCDNFFYVQRVGIPTYEIVKVVDDE